MAGTTLDETFPTYADLTQTRAWTSTTTAAVVGFDETIEISTAAQRYTEGEVLGVGGMGKVLLAHDVRIGREVAVKQLRGDRDISSEQQARFLREARVQGQLEHPSIVPVYDIDRRSDGSVFFTMRRVLGRTLHAIIEELREGGTRHTQRELLAAFATVCLTVDYAHSRGVIHRDIKPANIMLGDFGEVYVLDWGIARVLEDHERALAESAPRLSTAGELMGTPFYMAPEQMADPSVGPEADVFSLGAILFEILTLQQLRGVSTLYAPAEARPSVRAPRLGIAPELEAICVKATQSLPEDRFPSARALQEAVARYLEGDREIELRRARAAEHARAAREALARAEHGDHEREQRTAIRESARALALDPTHTEHVATFAKIMQTPPRTLPVEVSAQMYAHEQQLVRAGTKYSTIANLSWFLFVPLVLAMGIREPALVALILVPVGLSAVCAATATWWMREIPYWIQLAIIALAMVGILATTRMYGPLMLLPQLVIAITIVLQAHPQRSMRRLTLGFAVFALVVPLLLEIGGIVPSSYRFDGDTITVLPQLNDLPRDLSIAVLFGASLLALIVPCVFIAKLRRELTELQVQQLQQAWQFRRVGDELIGSKLQSTHAGMPRVQ